MDEATLTRLLGELLRSRRTASLGTLDSHGVPQVSMVPFAIEPTGALLVLHVSALAAHTGHLREHPEVSLMVVDAEVPGEPVHALHRVSFTGIASLLEPSDDATYAACRTAYLTRFSEAEFMTQLADFRFASIQILSTRQIAGFGAARDVDAGALSEAFKLLSQY
ncbi:MAG: pyridoxamine 5-phosphate oxidase-related, FMN-binding protein [Rhizobacter sp.]|nr:pyridoxamine 5-phosphate oxidase-related, FMN-binding protein [Rhizobacter sp.]